MKFNQQFWNWTLVKILKLKSTYRASPLNLIFLIILKLEQTQRRIFCQHFNVENQYEVWLKQAKGAKTNLPPWPAHLGAENMIAFQIIAIF